MTRENASNGFSQGLIMDYHPLGTPNTALSNALNATMITYNGNEASLQNDMGNGRVETAYLPEGYVPLGTTSFGGIIYIVSYNPLNDTCQIGSFPSPERNFTQHEKYAGEITINEDDFFDHQLIKGKIVKTKVKTNQVIYPLLNDKGEEIRLTPGDKFALNIADLYKYYDYLKGILKNGEESLNNPNIKLVLGIKQGGQLRELTDSRNYQSLVTSDNVQDLYEYIALANDKSQEIEGEKFNVQDYRNSVIDTNYNVVKCNISGTLCIIAKLVTLDNFIIKSKLKIDYEQDTV